MRGKRQKNEKQNNCKFIITGIILTCIIILILFMVNARRQKNNKDEEIKENNEGISLYNTTISEHVKETESGIKLNTSTFVNSDKILDNLTITNIQLTYSSGVTSLTANVTNNSNTETPITTITTILKDENKKEICKAKGVVKALGSGETGRINISMSGNFITAYDIEFSK